ncbi:MAG: VWA domain-containing protein [Clostridia bacterium]|nr:VWA domain-containing protein [Clostridia bacterium]
MNPNLTEIVFILDRSGSMAGLEADTVGGFNAMVERQQKEDGAALLSAVLFSNGSEVLYDRTDIRKVEPLTDAQYRVGGCTALLDAIGDAVHHIMNVHKYAREEDRPGKTVFVITTDGMENASRRYTYEAVQKLVGEARERYGWEFLFLGANMDAIAQARRFGISEKRAVRYECDSAGTALNFDVVSETIGSFRKCAEISDDWCAPIAQDYRERGRKDK